MEKLKDFINTITSYKVVNIIAMIAIVSSAFAIYRRLMIYWVGASTELIDFTANLHGFTMGIPFYFLIGAYFVVYDPKSRLTMLLNKICDIKIVSIVGYLMLVASCIAFALNMPIIVGSWTMVNTVIGTIMIGASLTRYKLQPYLAVSVGIAIMGMLVGFWEVPYQWSFKLIYDLPQVGWDLAWNLIYWETIIEIPLAGCGVWILIFLNRKYHFVKLNKWFWIFLSVYVALMVYWIMSGFWCDVLYDWATNSWYQSPTFDKVAMASYKISKVAMALAFISLIWRNKNGEVASNLDNSNSLHA